MNAQPKHAVIAQHLREAITLRTYKSGDRLPSESQLVRKFGVSRPTVGRALRDLQAEGLIERRAGSGSYVRSNPNQAAARSLGLLVPGLANTEIFQIICGDLASLARAHDYSLVWGGSTPPLENSDAGIQHAEDVCAQFIQQKLSGVFFAPVELQPEQGKANRKLAEQLRDAGLPVVLLDRDLTEYPSRSDFDLVGVDNMAGGYLLAEHLIKMGCKRIFFVSRPLSAPTVDARIAGAREALIRHRIEPDPDWIQTGDPADKKFVRRLVSGRRADAFICANDFTAAVLLRSLEAAGERVPRDFKIVGFDDVKYATLVSVPLTTIHQPCRDIATLAFRTMLERMAEPTLPAHNISLMPHLVVRESCGAYLQRTTGKAGGRSVF